MPSSKKVVSFASLPDVVAPAKKYESVSEALPDIVQDYLVEEAEPKQLHKKFNQLCRKPFSLKTMNTMLSEIGAPAKRRAYKMAFKRIAHIDERVGHKLANTKQKRAEMVERMADTLIKRKTVGAEKHFVRMEQHIDKADEVLKSIKPTKRTVGPFLNSLTTLDTLGRRLYGIDEENKSLSAHQLNIALLVNYGDDGVPPIDVDA